MRTLLLAAGLSFLLTGALACDYNRQAKSVAPITVADGSCGGSGCLVPDQPQDPVSTREDRVRGDAVQDCGGQPCTKKPSP